MDHVDKVIQQWNKERAGLDVTPMAAVGRVKRLAIFFGSEMEKTFKQFGLQTASFDVLATLRRSGPPYALSPGDLMASTMVTSGTMTHRIDQLVKAQLVTRTQSQQDKRSMLIALTPKGFELIDNAVTQHVETQRRLTQMLSQKEQQQLNALLRKITEHFEDSQ